MVLLSLIIRQGTEGMRDNEGIKGNRWRVRIKKMAKKRGKYVEDQGEDKGGGQGGQREVIKEREKGKEVPGYSQALKR